MQIHVITRCTRLNNLHKLHSSIFTPNKPKGIDLKWHIVFDTKILKDIDAELLAKYNTPDINLIFRKGDGWGLSQLNSLIQTLEGWVYHLDDDNLLHPDLYKYLESNLDTKIKAFVFSQQVDGKDFTGLQYREASPENMKVGKVDLAQWIIHSDLHKDKLYGSGYTADGEFIEKLYSEHSDQFKFIKIILAYYNALETKSSARVPKVLYIGPDTPELESLQNYNYEASNLNVKYVQSDKNVEREIVEFKPDCILSTVEDWKQLTELANMPIEVRRKWINIPNPTGAHLGNAAYQCAMLNMLSPDYVNDEETISFFTPIYNTGDKLYTTYASLVAQTYPNWEWVLVNDSTDGGKTLKIAEDIASRDPRVKVYDFRQKSGGIIGEVKYRACVLSRGYLLAELDHDDLLVPNCAMDLYKASKAHPECGFFYNDTLEVDNNWNSLTYPEGFCFGYGSYKDVDYNGKVHKVSNEPNINPKTIRHIVGVPNHIRAWRRTTYFEVGGHNRGLAIADDYELVVRTFLKTTFCKIPKLGYVQFLYEDGNSTNTHNLSRADIQRRVRTISEYYNTAIRDRFNELGLHDWAFEGNPVEPLLTPSRFGEEEQIANVIYREDD
jgi:glycosyltransferase involved in cell wall biosynthesis